MTTSRAPVTRRSTDQGFTVVELLVTTIMIGLIVVVITAAVTVVLRNEDGVATVIAESHDVQQAVNYFHLDVESGPPLVADWVVSGTRGTGCGDAGDENIFRYQTVDGRRVAYRLTAAGGFGRLDRYICSPSGSAWVEDSILNVADRLDASGVPGTPPVTVSLVADVADPTLVDRVVMVFNQAVGDQTVSAAPRPDTRVADADEQCDPDPLTATLGFTSMVEGDVHLETGELEGALAVGGNLSWGLGPISVSTQSTNSNPFSNVSIYATSVDWSASDPLGELDTSNGGSKVVALGGSYVVESGNPERAYETGPPYAGPRIATRGAIVPVTDYGLDFAAQFIELRKCSDALAALPRGAVAKSITPLDQNQNTYPGTAQPGGDPLMLSFADDAAAVLNLAENHLGDLTEVIRRSGSSLNASRPLIVNIDAESDGNVEFDFSSADWAAVGDAKFVLFNFPNATGTVEVQQDIHGVVFAPYAHVVTKGSVLGQVVARSWRHEGTVVVGASNNVFNSEIRWTASPW